MGCLTGGDGQRSEGVSWTPHPRLGTAPRQDEGRCNKQPTGEQVALSALAVGTCGRALAQSLPLQTTEMAFTQAGT